VYCDASHLRTLDGKPTLGKCINVNGSLLFAVSKKGTRVSTSACEAETLALVRAVKDLESINILLDELQENRIHHIRCDNVSTVLLADRNKGTKKSAHFVLDINYIQDRVKANDLIITYVSTQENLADIFTKPLGPTKCAEFRKFAFVTSAC
jgi:histone deacetylase 1/2